MTRSADYLKTAADRTMMQDLLARYAWEIDHGSPEGYAALFTRDGFFEAAELKLRVQGTDELVFDDANSRSRPVLAHSRRDPWNFCPELIISSLLHST